MQKSNARVIGNKWLCAVLGVVLFGLPSIGSTEGFKTGPTINYLTFSQPVALPGVVLPPGVYTFEVLMLGGDVVRVSGRDDRTTRYLGFTRQVIRPRTMPANSAVALGEAVTGAPRPIRAWFPIGESTGRQFVY